MKTRISATVEKETIGIIKNLLKKGKYRNKSHVIEEAIKLLSKEKKWKNQKEGKLRFLL